MSERGNPKVERILRATVLYQIANNDAPEIASPSPVFTESFVAALERLPGLIDR